MTLNEHGPDEATLLARARAGDADAFEALFRRYRERVYRVVWGYVRNEEDALDVTQDAFLKAYRKLAAFEGKSSFFTWVTQIAINRAIDVSRKRKRRKDIPLEQSHDRGEASRLPGRSPPSRPPSAGVEQEELERLFRRALESLSDKHRTVFLLHTQQGLAYKEIARTLDISIGTVMSRLHYARKRLQRALGAYLGPDPRRRVRRVRGERREERTSDE